jgi:fucose permease
MLPSFFFHISEGLGAFTSPWVATQFSTMIHFTYHYFISAGVAVVNITYTLAIFRLRTQERMFDFLSVRLWRVLIETVELYAVAGHDAGQARIDACRTGKYRQLVGHKAVWFIAAFAIIYVGVEVTLGGMPSSMVWPRLLITTPRLDCNVYNPKETRR